MRRSLGLAVTGLAAAAVLSACGHSSDPTAQSSTSGPATPQTTTSSKAPVNRPKQLKLDGVDPCSLLTAQQQQQLKTHRAKPGTDEGFKSPDCDFFAMGGSYRLTTVTNAGAEGWSNGTYKGQTSQMPPVNGFPTLSNVAAEDPTACDVVIDTADGQYLLASSRISPSQQQYFPEKCAAARQVAEMAVQSLLASH